MHHLPPLRGSHMIETLAARSFMPWDCQIRFDYLDTMFFMTTFPIVIVLLFYSGGALCRCAHGRMSGRSATRDLLDQVGDKATPICLFIIFMVYVQCSQHIFEVLRWGVCDRFVSESDTDSGSNTPSYVSFFSKDYSISCDEIRFNNVRTYAWVMLLIYPVGTPILYCGLYWRYRRTLHALNETERMLAKASSLHEYTGKAMRRSSWDPSKMTHSFGGDQISESSARNRKLSHWRRPPRGSRGSTRSRGSTSERGSAQERGSIRERGSTQEGTSREVQSASHDPLGSAQDQLSSHDQIESHGTSIPQRPATATRAPARAFILRSKSQNQLALEHLMSIKETSTGRLERMKDELPSFMIGLVGPYEFRCYWFEVFEVCMRSGLHRIRAFALRCRTHSCNSLPSLPQCLRKVGLTGIIVFFPRGSLQQLVIGLTLCVFLSWFHHNLKPYRSDYDDWLAQFAQGVIFLNICSKIIRQEAGLVQPPPWWIEMTDIIMAVLLATASGLAGMCLV